MVDRVKEVAETERVARQAALLGKDDAIPLCTAGIAFAYVLGKHDYGAALMERAVALTFEPSLRADRAVGAAQTRVQAGAFDAVQDLLATAESPPVTELQQARVDLVRAQLAFVTDRGSDAAPLLLSAAKRLDPVAPDLARQTYLDAMLAAQFAGRLAAPGGSLMDSARAASGALADPHTAADRLLHGLAASVSQGYAAGSATLRAGLEDLRDAVPADQDARVLRAAYLVAMYMWDHDACLTISDRRARLCRETGALSELPLALNGRAITLALAGDLAGAASLVDEVRAVTEATGIHAGRYGAMALAAVRGNEPEAAALIDASVTDATLRQGKLRVVFAGDEPRATSDGGRRAGTKRTAKGARR